MDSKPGTVSGAVEHRYGGKCFIGANRNLVKLLTQEAIIRRDLGEEGVKRFWEMVDCKAKAGKSRAMER